LLARLRILDAFGTAIDLDSLGSGPLDLPALRQVPARRARVDANLLERLAARGDAKRPLLALVSLARGLGLRITATSVASAALVEELRAAGVDQAQGPFFGGAVSADAVPRLVAGAPAS
jgi:diguanylate cyclase